MRLFISESFRARFSCRTAFRNRLHSKTSIPLTPYDQCALHNAHHENAISILCSIPCSKSINEYAVRSADVQTNHRHIFKDTYCFWKQLNSVWWLQLPHRINSVLQTIQRIVAKTRLRLPCQTLENILLHLRKIINNKLNIRCCCHVLHQTIYRKCLPYLGY